MYNRRKQYWFYVFAAMHIYIETYICRWYINTFLLCLLWLLQRSLPTTRRLMTVLIERLRLKSTLQRNSPASSSWTGSSWRKAGLFAILKYARLANWSDCAVLSMWRARSKSPRRASNVNTGAGLSSLYHNTRTTSSPAAGGSILHGSATFPRTTAQYTIDAVI